MYWADKIAKEIVDSGKFTPYWVDDMKTPSGRVHIGSVRAALSHELIYRALKDLGKDVTFTYVLEDHDPMDGLPVYVDQEKYKKHLGEPLYVVPSPEPGYKSFGERWGKEYIEIFHKIGVFPKIIWGSELYKSGKMNDMVKLCLDKAEIIRGIYKTLYGKRRPSDWYPFQVVCEKCGKLSTTVVVDWDGKEVTYECREQGLEWTKGCGNKGKTSPFSDEKRIAGKLPWKVEWPCKWKVIGVTVEGAGKDHMSAGGSHDFAKLMCQKVIDYPVPYAFSHEFFLVGGKKMSSSKGLGSSAKEISEIVPPYLVRFMIAKVKYNQQIDFNPIKTMQISDYFDEYDRAGEAFWNKSNDDLARIFELSQVDGKPPKKLYLPRFRDVANYLQQPGIDLKKKFSELKGDPLKAEELTILKEREKYAKIWLENYAPQELKLEVSEKLVEEAKNLSSSQKEYLGKLADLVEKSGSAEGLEKKMYDLAKESGLSTKDAFRAIYTTLLGKDHGPKAAWLIMGEKEKSLKLFREASK